MNGDRFDTLTRSLSASGSRRRALALALSGALAPLLGVGESEAHDLLKKCKKLKGDKKKKCVKKAKAHNSTHLTEAPPPPPPPTAACTPNCSGKNCGLDGCGGLCGPCNDGTCTAGTCVCPAGMELCQDTCVAECPGLAMRIPGTCSCCMVLGSCDSVPCCGRCGGSSCEGLREGDFCTFDAQCQFNICTDGRCRCPRDKEPCAGLCWTPCPPGRIREPNCNCCITNGSNCEGASNLCCAGTNRCTGTGNTTCEGLPDGASCTFSAQCADTRFGCTGGKCGPVVGE